LKSLGDETAAEEAFGRAACEPAFARAPRSFSA
jgi:hypothetical protein